MSELNTRRLFLLDAYALIYRAHFAFTKNPRINSKGRNTSVPFGFTNTLLEVLQKQRPTHIGVAFDTAAPTFRDEIFAEYKANRQETPEDIRYGIPVVKEIIRGFNIPILEMDGYEADDLIGTLALRAADQGFEVYMMTPDKDYGQIVRERVFLYKPAYMGNAVDILGPKEVCEKWDIENVGQVIDMLGLQGDSSDNIPGIPGFGPKTAAVLLKQFGSIENIIAHAAELKGKQKELVETYAEQALLSKRLATIDVSVPIAFDPDLLAYKGPDKDKLAPIFDDLEFKSLTARALGVAPGATPVVQARPSQLSMFDAPAAMPIAEKRTFDETGIQYHRIESENEIRELANRLQEKSLVGLEIETDEAPNFDFRPVAIAIASDVGRVDYWELREPEQLKLLTSLFEDGLIRKIGHNLKPVALCLQKAGVQLAGKLFDTLLAHYLIEPEASHDLDILAQQYLNYQLSGAIRSAQDRLCERADVALQLGKVLQAELEARGQSLLMRDVEVPLITVLSRMEFEGVQVDESTLKVMSAELKTDSDSVQEQIYQLAGTQFNIGSPKQLGEVLFDRMHLMDKAKKTKTGQYATGEEVLAKLAEDHPIARLILDYRELEKLRSTYVDALPRMISKMDGRIHSDFRQAVAATGRLSSNNPNLQNIPIRTEKGRAIRRAFVSRNADYVFMSADYSQIELRIAASFAKDETMIEAFRSKRDIHRTTAAKVFRVALEDVTPDMRRKAKEVNFGILYGSTAFGLSQNLGISRTEAGEIIDSYFREFPGIKRYMDDAINQARETEFVETILGRRRYLRDINSKNITTRGFAERNAINAPIQGSAADIIKIAMIQIDRWLKREKLRSKMILQVHDELVFDVHREELDYVRERVADLMEGAVSLEVPMAVEVGVGTNWLEAH